MSRILALDLGEKRVGVAVSDETQVIATALDLIPTERLLPSLKVLLQDLQVEKILIGLPISMDGREHAQAERIRIQAAKLESKLDVPFEFRDERLTSVQALRFLQDFKVKGAKDKKDSLSAQIILQNYLDAKNV
ncbi:MAG: Holliday junction resolvase RuvX [Candidatus Gracilibacteria bacterium]|nr:Holliday junction resolvase RuvX [Candidatus Gracilibacteria bacterium]